MHAAPRQQVTVLVVADDDERRTVLSDVLRRDGYHVLVADGAHDAATHLARPATRIDLVLSDARLGTPTALDLARLVRATPLMIVDEAMDPAGDATTLPKPFRLDVLRRAVLTTIVANVKRDVA
jgi:CheY-like chemotaxis protein